MAHIQKTLLNTEERGVMMICTGGDCQERIKEPLELFDGSLACPHCACILKHNFAVTEQNDNLFRLSQAYYFQYLAMAAAVDKSVEQKKLAAIQKKLEIAVKYCRDAARLGHPEACVKLGFYWETGYMQKRESVERFKMAFRYYDEVVQMDERALTLERDDGGAVVARDYEKNEKILAVKREAAVRLLRLLAEAGEDLQNMMGFNLAALTERLKFAVGDSGETAITEQQPSREEFVLRTLKDAKKNAGDAPVFGYFLMPANALAKAYGDENSADNSEDKIYNIMRNSGKLDVKWAFLEDLNDGDAENNTFNEVTDSADCLPDISAGEKPVVVAFVNGAWQSKPSKEIGKKKTKSLNKLSTLIFTDNEPTDAFHNLCTTANLGFAKIFYADDLYFGCLKNAKNPVEGILEYVMEKRKDGDN